MNAVTRAIVGGIVANEALWSLLDSTVLRAARSLDHRRFRYTILDAAIAEHVPDLSVRHGPFKGMRYSQAESLYSALFPKLLGCYERELHYVLEDICGREYTDVIDIGCAEGYYAVGLALRLPGARVLALDLNPDAVQLCDDLARTNGVQDRVTASLMPASDVLASFEPEGRALIVADCEGCEKTVFTKDVVRRLGNTDLLIEVHDYLLPDTSIAVREAFADTHDIHAIKSVCDCIRASTWDYPELEGYDLDTRRLLVEERRPLMEWFYLTPKETTARG
jgi:SAM-dependent methyltransferase